MNKEIAERLIATEFTVKATDTETLFLWEQWHKEFKWEQLTLGMMETVKELEIEGKKWPVCLSGCWSRLAGHLVFFYDGVSVVVHHDLIDAWVRTNVPNRKGNTNSGNFHICLQRLGII